jgi:hypothetical protein
LRENDGSHIVRLPGWRLQPESLIELQDFPHSTWIVGNREAIENHDLACPLAMHASRSNQNGKAGIAISKTEVT